jgi:hypothetical protein
MGLGIGQWVYRILGARGGKQGNRKLATGKWGPEARQGTTVRAGFPSKL